MLYTVGVIISLFLCVILLTKKDKSQADKILALWLLISGVHLFMFNLYITKQYRQFPYLLGFDLPMPLLHGSFIFLYVTALTQKERLKAKMALHFVPYFVGLCTLHPFFILPYHDKINTYDNKGAGFEVLLIILFVAIIISGIGYTLVSLQKLYRHKKNITNLFSNTEKINLSWLRYLILGSGIIWLLVIFGTDEVIFGAIVVYVFFIGFFGIKQVGIFTNPTKFVRDKPIIQSIQNNIEERISTSKKNKYEKSNLSYSQADAIYENLTQIMQEEKPFLNPYLGLNDLAEKLQVHPNTLSQIINTKEQRNFFDYINRHRIEQFKHEISRPDNQKFTILSIAYDCGFNSKTTFNRNFKKVTGLSPTQYLKQVKSHLGSS
ncbi:helix-turn-helix domain-containing protein [Galbibacter sp. EGI 63066]|uniref:helix-turn-helix domain-containing protein n=1 Tax=Galbibacter sp. EGI 63066 TaxID=2993559 RepID=UPI0022488AAC|nr:helix-turn-helix domain-containing protein [Galbibacter sp. EGI 63066]MCX2681131.1 helix-turn-helix domain-containing protein [Galbibacter sp. EGI 63066]